MKSSTPMGSGNDGVALIMTLAVMAILVSLVMALNTRIHLRTDAARWARDQAVMQQTGEAVIHGAMALLSADKYDNDEDSPADIWADPVTVAALLTQMGLPIANLTVTISDEHGRIPVNALVTAPNGRQFDPLQEQIWSRLLVDPGWADTVDDPVPLLESLKDWLDRNDDDAISGLSGAERGYYESLTPPVVCRNGPIRHLSDLAHIKGYSQALVYGTAETPGLADYLTVWGWDRAKKAYNARININTAPLPIIAALIPVANRPCAEQIVAYRDTLVAGKDHLRLSKPQWYKDAPNCQHVTIDPNAITVVSDLYRIEAQVIQPPLTVTITAVVERRQREKTGEWGCRILLWQQY